MQSLQYFDDVGYDGERPIISVENDQEQLLEDGGLLYTVHFVVPHDASNMRDG